MIGDWLSPGEAILEVGSGPGSVVAVLREAGHHVTGLDVADNSYSDDLRPVVYDGATMPFEANAFDVALILTTLHHTSDPDRIIAQASRVARRLIVIEDVYDTRWQEIYTKVTDAFTNLEFIGHPHSNRSDAQWRACFERFGFRLRYRKIHRLLKFYQQAVYVLDIGSSTASTS